MAEIFFAFERALKDLDTGAKGALIAELRSAARGNADLLEALDAIESKIHQPELAFPSIPRGQDPLDVYYQQYLTVRSELQQILDNAQRAGIPADDIARIRTTHGLDADPLTRDALADLLNQPSNYEIKAYPTIDDRATFWASINTRDTLPTEYTRPARPPTPPPPHATLP